MILTIFLAIIICGAVTMMLVSGVAFVQEEKFFSSAPKEAQELLIIFPAVSALIAWICTRL